MYGDYENWTYNYRKEELMLDKLKLIAQKLGVSSLFIERCGCGYTKYKRTVWASPARSRGYSFFGLNSSCERTKSKNTSIRIATIGSS